MGELDFFDLDMFSRGVPHDVLTRLRREAPVSRHRIPHAAEGEGFWLVARHRDICEVARQPRLFMSHAGSVLTDSVDIAHPAWRMVREGLCHLDAPRHGELRRLVMPSFGAEAMEDLERVIRQRAVEALERVQAMGRFDVVADLAAWFPVRVVYGDVLGFAQEDLGDAAFWGDLFNRVHAVPPGDREFASMMRASGGALERLYRYGCEAFRTRQGGTGRDVLSMLANMRHEDGQALSLDDFLSYFWSLAIGAYDTTASTIAGGLAALAAHPLQEDLLHERPELVGQAVEEMLRWETPVIYFRRTATADCELNGQAIRRGDRVLMCFASGNRDEDVFEDAHRFDIGRVANPHLSFGHGAHFCLGARLARLELRVLFEEMVARGMRVRAAGAPVRARSNFINRIVQMPATLEPAAALDVVAFD